MTQTQTGQTFGSGFPAPPRIPGGEEAYNRIMSKIELDLTTENLPTLPQKYANETKEQRKERAERYRNAFKQFRIEYKKFRAQQQRSIREYPRKALKAIENRSATSESARLSSLESAISQS